jgi:hypothetical protein
MVETAIMLPLLLVVTFAIVEFGVLFTVNLALESGVTRAARFGMTGATADGQSREASMMAVLRRATPMLTIDDASIEFSHFSGGGWAPGVGGPGAIQRLSVSYSHDLLVLMPLLGRAQINLRAESTMKNEERFE